MPMYTYGILIGVLLVVISWFLFVAPMERRVHERKIDLMRRKLERNEERLRQLRMGEQFENASDGAESN